MKILTDLMEFWEDSTLTMVSIHVAMGEEQKAMEQLEKVERTIPFRAGLIAFLPHYHIYEELWDNPVFQSIIERNNKRKTEVRRKIQLLEEQGIN